MEQYILDARIKNGYLSIGDLPFKEETDVKVIVMPKVKFNDLSFLKVRDLTKSIKDNISDEISTEREEE
ncbi:MAG: hypothetical protein K9I71_10675 [Ignavibacteriales bacterium]|nr:hypothetical protein [Ignavibacteriales bacterium]MCF8438298.1 hypothetical protein [Ignavibacteriales bacterium]